MDPPGDPQPTGVYNPGDLLGYTTYESETQEWNIISPFRGVSACSYNTSSHMKMFSIQAILVYTTHSLLHG